MTATLRMIYELVSATGLDPEVALDTDDLAPPTFTGIVARKEQLLQIGPAASEQAVTIGADCLVLIVSDKPILVRLASAETQIRARLLAFHSEASDENTTAGLTLRLSGNTVNTATVRIIELSTVA